MSERTRCVIVDDDHDFTLILRYHLERLHPEFEVHTFTSGLEAFGYVLRNHVDLLITDFRMPVLDGLRLTTRVRSLFKQVLVVIMSGEDIEASALAAGANVFVRKADLPAQLGPVLESLPLPVPVEPRPSERLR